MILTKTVFQNPQDIIATCALFVSIISILISVGALSLQKKHNRKSLKPIGIISCIDRRERIEINIQNCGIGPLIIDKIIVYNDEGVTTNNIIDWIPPKPEGYLWKNFISKIRDHVILPGNSLNLFKTIGEEDNLVFVEYRNKIRNVLKTLSIDLHYYDIYDKKQPLKTTRLDWFERTKHIVE